MRRETLEDRGQPAQIGRLDRHREVDGGDAEGASEHRGFLVLAALGEHPGDVTKCEPLVGPVAGSVPGVDDEPGQFEGGVEITAAGGERGELGPGEGDDPAVADRHALLHRLFEHRRRPAWIERFDGDRSGVERRRQRGGVADALGEAQRLLRQRPALLGPARAREPDGGHVEGVDEAGHRPCSRSGSDHALAHGGRLGAAAPVVEDVAHGPPVEAARSELESLLEGERLFGHRHR